MARFEKYHPIMTAHYTLDWLTAFKVKEINALRQDAGVAQAMHRPAAAHLTDTVEYVSHEMLQIMSDKKLVWGIQERSNQTFLGIFVFQNFDKAANSAEVQYELLPQFQQQGIMSEILQHMTRFAFDELHLAQLQAVIYQDQPGADAVLKNAGFHVREDLTVLDHDPSVSPDKFVVYTLEQSGPAGK